MVPLARLPIAPKTGIEGPVPITLLTCGALVLTAGGGGGGISVFTAAAADFFVDFLLPFLVLVLSSDG